MFVNKNKDKRGVSILVSYVLLITLALALAAGTYYFLRTYAEKPLPEEGCPEGTNVVIENYSCEDNMLDITLKNRGLHSITGVYIKIANESESELLYDFWEITSRYDPTCIKSNNCTPCELYPGGECSETDIPYNIIKKIVIIPYKAEGSYTSLCDNAVISLNVECPPI